MTNDEIYDLWLSRVNFHGGVLMPQLYDLVNAALEKQAAELAELKAELQVYKAMHKHPTIRICGVDSRLHWIPLTEDRLAKIISEAKSNAGAPRLA